jgi:pyrimidine-nucleoside phosphorylase
MVPMIPQWIIEKKRNGHPLTGDEIRDFISGFCLGAIPDYQMSALAMAIFFQGMSAPEISALTRVMLESGDSIDLTSLDKPRIDKHSTGGVGDKVSLILAPLVACCGIAVPMVAGRGLGITGGTLDKLESIPGYRTDLSTERFVRIVRECGCSIVGQTPRLCPADRKLYALRDVTGTVPSIPLITASIMCKKLAESLTGLVLDVKCGSGAFMRTREEAEMLAHSLMAVGVEMNLPVSAWITCMEEPLGRSAGNRPEIAEVVHALRNEGPADLMAVTLALAARMLRLAGLVRSDSEAIVTLQQQLRSGAAEARFRDMVRWHGGDPAFLDDPDRIERTAPCSADIVTPSGGWVARVNAEEIGRACVLLGAGRSSTADTVDPCAGISKLLKVGETANPGHIIARLFTSDPARIEAARAAVENAYTFADHPVEKQPVLLADMGVNMP